ncbi:Transcriptional regulator, AcrR family [hydrothermal vent metagenome]|uniref:Transcriptional regulator, AcrR family n=1 Tax=hydrothermal vent metagenome TaxID=652676 RepID=A0A3B0TBM7_9ZZZZ
MKHSLVRETIIKTASNLFYQKGYNLTGINEIISESGIAKATLYNHFKSKEDICVAYLNNLNTPFLKDIEKFSFSKPKGSKQILALFDFLENFFHSENFNGCWCLNTISEIPNQNKKIREEIQKGKNNFLELIIKIVEINFPNKTKNEVATLSKQIYLIYESAISESHLHQNEWPIKTAKIIIQKIFS